MVACTTRAAFAEIRQVPDDRLLRSDNAVGHRADSSGTDYAPSDDHARYEVGGIYFFLTYGRVR
jgi:hypothetical protein